MPTWICVLLITTAVPDETGIVIPSAPAARRASSAPLSGFQSENSPRETARPPRELRAAVHKSLRAVATESGAARDLAIRRLAAVYVELSRDTQLPVDERLTLGRTIRARLIKVKEQIVDGRKRAGRSSSNLASHRPANATSSGAVSGSASASAGTSGSTGTSAPTGAPGGAAQDDGEALVDLIQQTIAPSTWDLNGGLGTIRYFSPLHAIVVRQTAEGHDLVGGVLNGLRD